MRITTDRDAARKDTGNRHAALEQIKSSDPELLAECNVADQEQWIDDVINEWVDDLKRELTEGLYDADIESERLESARGYGE